MFSYIWKRIKEVWASLFRRDPKYTENDVTENILSNLIKLSRKGRINIYHGTPTGLRQALGDYRSIVYIVEVVEEPPKRDLLNWHEYTKKLKSLWNKPIGEEDGQL